MRSLVYTIFSVLTAMISYHINTSIFWAIMAFIFSPLAWIKWLLCHQVTLQIIRDTFSWFFN